MKLFDAIDEANRAGRLGLILYTIPNFPDPNTFRAILELMTQRSCVSIIEMTFAVDEAFSEHANETIRAAHRQACRHGAHYRDVLSAYRFDKPSLCVLYEKTAREHTFEQVARDMNHKVDGVLLEWNEREHQGYFESTVRNGLELVQCVGPWMTDEELRHILGFCRPEALVYLMSAPMTGGQLFSVPELEQTLSRTRAIRPDIKVAAGFGIRTPEDVRQVSRVHGLDGVIIGTAFLEKMRAGVDAVSAYLDELEGALANDRA